MLHVEGPLLTIDVGTREESTEQIDHVLGEFIGGRGVATSLAHDRIPFDADPFGPENRLYVTAGPLQMSQMSFTGRMNMTGLSPLTDGLLSSNAGGFLSRNFLATGHSALELVGESDELLFVHVTDNGVEFEEVPTLAGASVKEVTEYATQRHGLDAEQLIAIGPAGENRVRFAAAMTSDSRAFARGGLGAVLGSKNIKAISFRGDSSPDERIDEEVEMTIHRRAATSDQDIRSQGTAGATELLNDQFSLPTRYYSDMSFEHATEIGGEMAAKKKYKKGTCSVCAFACKMPTRDEETGIETEGPEFETIYSFGSSCGVKNFVDIMQSNELCDTLGMDTISCGLTVAAYLDSEDEFGNAELVHNLVEKIAYREGIGDLLAEGIDRIHGELGVENWTVKGMEFAGHDGRIVNGQALSYAVANRGADHLYAGLMGREYFGDLDPEGLDGKAEALVEEENQSGFRDSGIVCSFSSRHIETEEIEALFGAEYDELMEVGARIVELERHFNNERGKDVEDDTLPYADMFDNLDEAIREYYALRGWKEDGTTPALEGDSSITAD